MARKWDRWTSSDAPEHSRVQARLMSEHVCVHVRETEAETEIHGEREKVRASLPAHLRGLLY